MDETEGATTSTEGTEIPLPDLGTPTPDATADQSTDATADATNPDDGEPDPVEAAVQARLALEADKMAEAALRRAREESFTREQEAQQQQLNAAEAERLSNSFSTAIREAYDAAKRVRFMDADGNEATLDDRTFEEVVVRPMQKFNSTAERAYQLRIYGVLAQSAMELLPADEREKFAKDAANQPLPIWLKKLGEVLAPHSEHAKVLQKEIDTKVKAAEARGFVKGQKAPAGTPRASGERTGNTNQPDLTTAYGIADAKSKGLIDDNAAFKAWQKLSS